MDNNIIKSVVYSEFTNQGPTPKIYWPEDLDEMGRTIIAMKTISLLMGDSVYQDGFETEGINYFGIIPFPDLELQGLTYFFLIEDLDSRGNAKAATITVLVDENNKSFFYENMKYLRVIIDNTASKIQEYKAEEQLEKIIEDLKIELFNFTSELRDPFSSKRQIKVLFIGLDKAGKTSFLFGVKQKYSEIIKAMPTKGVNREQEHLFSEESSQISIWDLGGQAQYRKKYLEQSKIYLYDVDLIFYFLDIQDSERIDEAMELYKKVIHSLKEIGEYPPIVVLNILTINSSE
jgi:small GTP-binding protein